MISYKKNLIKIIGKKSECQLKESAVKLGVLSDNAEEGKPKWLVSLRWEAYGLLHTI